MSKTNPDSPKKNFFFRLFHLTNEKYITYATNDPSTAEQEYFPSNYAIKTCSHPRQKKGNKYECMIKHICVAYEPLHLQYQKNEVTKFHNQNPMLWNATVS